MPAPAPAFIAWLVGAAALGHARIPLAESHLELAYREGLSERDLMLRALVLAAAPLAFG